MVAKVYLHGLTWQQVKDSVSLTRTAHWNYGRPVQHSLQHTGLQELPQSQDEHWFPWAEFRIVGGSQHGHENVWCTWKYPCCWSDWPQSWGCQCGHAVTKQSNQPYKLVCISIYMYVRVCTSTYKDILVCTHTTYLWGLTRAVIWIAPQHDLAHFV